MTGRIHSDIAVVLSLMAVSLILAACDLPFGGADESGVVARGGGDGDSPRGVILNDPGPAPDFVLTDHTGAPYRLSDHEGDAIAIFFGYTGCPDICPLTLMHMSAAAEQLGAQADDVSFLFITVDPERDDPERLAQYISRMDVPLVALTGTADELEPVLDAYDIVTERHDREDGTYLIDHSAQVWLIAPNGELTMFLPMGSDGDDLARDLAWLLEQDV